MSRVTPLRWATLTLVLCCACGGHTPAAAQDVSDSGVEGQDASMITPTDASEAPPSDAGESMDWSAPTWDGACAASIQTFQPTGTAFQSCWSCAEQACASELAACAADCLCNALIARALACTQDGLGIAPCFAASFNAAGDPAENSLQMCLMQRVYASGCPTCSAVVATDDAAAPFPPGTNSGGGSSGNGACSEEWTQTLDAASYTVSCSCPEGACVCFGPTTHIVPYPGCPFCPGPASPTTVAGVFDLCGFP